MKEAAGEANMTVITIVLIAIVLAIGTVIVNKMLTSTEKSSCCTANGGVWKGGKCWESCKSDALSSCTGENTISTSC